MQNILKGNVKEDEGLIYYCKRILSVTVYNMSILIQNKLLHKARLHENLVTFLTLFHKENVTVFAKSGLIILFLFRISVWQGGSLKIFNYIRYN